MPNDATGRFAAAAIGAGIAEAATLPIDMAKVRLQTQIVPASGIPVYKNMVQSIGHVMRTEGPTALWKGMAPALMRQCSYTGMSFVLYTPIRDCIAGEGVHANDIPFYKRVLSGGLAGGISITMMNPTDVIKTQMQAATGTKRMAPLARNIYAQSGLGGFWMGVQPNVARCFIGNACEIGCYDHAKTTLIKWGMPEGPLAHFGASGFAGVVSAVFSTPVDVVKTRLMNQAGNTTGGVQQYKGVVDCFVNMPRREGIGSLYKGFVPLAARKITWTVVYFVFYEQLLALTTGSHS